MDRAALALHMARSFAARGQRLWSIAAPGDKPHPAETDWPDGVCAYISLDCVLGWTEEDTPIVVYPTGLALPVCDVVMTWKTARPGQYLVGTAHSVLKFCRRARVDPAHVYVVPEESVHGTCVWEGGEHGKMVQAHWLR